jgi:hypothetical protein
MGLRLGLIISANISNTKKCAGLCQVWINIGGKLIENRGLNDSAV